MTVHLYSREGAILRAREVNNDLASMIEFSGNTRRCEAHLLTTANEQFIPNEGDYLLSGVYVAARYDGDKLYLDAIRQAPENPDFSRATLDTLGAAIESIPFLESRTFVGPSLAKQAIIAMLLEIHTVDHHYLTGLELWTPSLGSSMETYTTIVTPKKLRQAPRMLSERMLRLAHEEHFDQIVDGYTEFAYSQDDVRELAMDLAASTIYQLHSQRSLTDPGATIDTEPRDTH